MASRITGLNSGLDTDAMVKELVSAYSKQKDNITKKQTKLEWKQEAWKELSLEEHMACGVGACLGCVVKTTEEDHHSHVHNARICTDGPVFEAGEVEI